MSASRRRKSSGPPPMKTTRGGRDPGGDADELPTLEPLADDDDLPTLDALEDDGDIPTLDALDEVDDSPVTVTAVADVETGFDACFEVVVPEMEKAAVAEAITPPLRRAASRHGAAIRWKTLLVRFGGDAVIGSAIKGLVAEVLEPARPLKVVVRRGFGDEVVHEAELPTVDVDVQRAGATLQVGVFTKKLDPEDLTTALTPELAKLGADLNDAETDWTFTGKAKPDAAVRAWLSHALAAAGAKRATLAGDVLFDRELEARVRVSTEGPATTIEVYPADDAAVTCSALELVLPRAADALAGRDVSLRFCGRAAQAVELAKFLECCAASLPARIGLEQPGGGPDVLWPRLLRSAVRDDQAVIQVDPQGRDRQALLTAFRRETSSLGGTLAQKRVTVDWPAGTEIDAELERVCLTEALGAFGPASISCTIAGDQREPFVPAPVVVATDGAATRVRIDTDLGKPAELLRAIERRLTPQAGTSAGRAVRVELTGGGTVSRTMLRTVRSLFEDAGVTRLEIDDHGAVDVLVPALLHIGSTGADRVTIAATASSRDDAQIEAALARELDAHDLAMDATFVVDDGPLAARVIDVLVARGARRVVRGGTRPVQVHPPLFTTERAGDALTLRAAPDGDDATLRAQVDAELATIGALDGVTVRIEWPDVVDSIPDPLGHAVDVLAQHGPTKVLIARDGRRPRQAYPEIVLDYVTVLGRKDDVDPPIVLLGIDVVDDHEHAGRLLAKLDATRDVWNGKRVLLVQRDEGHEVAIADGDEFVAMVRTMLDTSTAAVLVYRGVDAHRRPYFEVVHSSLPNLAVGARIADPRGARSAAG